MFEFLLNQSMKNKVLIVKNTFYLGSYTFTYKNFMTFVITLS